MRLRTRAEIDQEPRIAQFHIQRHCADDGDPDLESVAEWHKKHPTGECVEVYLFPIKPHYGACSGTHWKLTPTAQAKHRPEQSKEMFVCEHMGELIAD